VDGKVNPLARKIIKSMMENSKKLGRAKDIKRSEQLTIE